LKSVFHRHLISCSISDDDSSRHSHANQPIPLTHRYNDHSSKIAPLEKSIQTRITAGEEPVEKFFGRDACETVFIIRRIDRQMLVTIGVAVNEREKRPRLPDLLAYRC
jgi:hypothetical protein